MFYPEQIERLREKIGQLEEELVQLQMENIRLKKEIEEWERGATWNGDRKYATSTFCGTPEQYQAWLKLYGTNTT